MITDRKLAMREIKRANPDYNNIEPEFFQDRKFCLSAVRAHGEAYKHIAEEFKYDREIAEMAAEKLNLWGSLKASDFPKELMADKSFVKYAIAVSSHAVQDILYNASPELQDDKDICMSCVLKDKSAYFHVSDRLKEDKDICMAAATSWTYQSMPLSMREDVDVFAKAVPYDLFRDYDSSGKKMLSATPESVLNDPRAIIAMIKNNVHLIEDHLPEVMVNDKKNILDMMEAGFRSYNFAHRIPEEFKADKDFAIAAIKIESDFYRNLSDELKADIDVVKEATKQDPELFHYAPIVVFENRDLAIAAVTSDFSNYAKLTDELKADTEVAISAALNNTYAYDKFPEEIQRNEGVVLAALSSAYGQNPTLKDVMTELSLCADKDFMFKAIELNQDAIAFTDKSLRQDRDFMLSTVPHVDYADSFKSLYLGSEFTGKEDSWLNDKDFILKAIEKSPEILTRANVELRSDPEFIKECVAINPKCKNYRGMTARYEVPKETFLNYSRDKVKEEPEKKAPKRDTGMER